jgi:hypothetical protein
VQWDQCAQPRRANRAAAAGRRCKWRKGPAKQKQIGDPRGGWVRVRKKTKDQGQIYFFDIFIAVFFISPYRERRENNVLKQNPRKKRFWILVEFVVKTFRFSTRFFCKPFFCSVFELLSQKDTQKRDKTKKNQPKKLWCF